MREEHMILKYELVLRNLLPEILTVTLFTPLTLFVVLMRGLPTTRQILL